MNKKEIILKDLENLHYYGGLNAGRWEQNEYDRLHLMKEWMNRIENLAEEYNIKFDTSNLDFDDEYELDEFYFDLSEEIRIKLEKLLLERANLVQQFVYNIKQKIFKR